MFRKSVLTTAIIGAGLVSTAGAAFAGDDPCAGEHDGQHHSSHSKTVNSNNDSSCSNAVGASNSVTQGDSSALGNVATPISAPITSNICHVIEHNGNGSFKDNHVSIGSSLFGGGFGSFDQAPDASQVESTANQAPSTGQAQSAVPSGTTTTPIQGK